MGMARAKRGTGREALLEAALQLVGERGLQGLSMRDIAAAAQMSLGLTTYHFADRDALLRETLQRFADAEVQRYEHMLAALTEADASAEQIIDALISGIHDAFARPGYTVALLELYLAAARDPAMSAIAYGCVDGYRRLTGDALIAAGMPIEQARRTARWIMVFVDGFASHAAAAGTPTRLPADLNDAIHAIATAAASP
jgi:DNA-binding transcriptional regulator YbjK